jgi:hypothetical protein
MSPQGKGSKRGTGWKPPRDRREVAIALLASLAVIVVTASLVWFLRPNRDSGSSIDTNVTTPSTVPVDATTTVPADTQPTDTTVAPTTAPAATSTP